MFCNNCVYVCDAFVKYCVMVRGLRLCVLSLCVRVLNLCVSFVFRCVMLYGLLLCMVVLCALFVFSVCVIWL